jgi:hypothetical protein
VNPVLQGDYILQFTAVEGTSPTVMSVSDGNGGSDTWSKVAGSDLKNDVEIWMAQAAQTSAGGSGFGVTSTLTGTAADSVVLGWDIGSISSATPEVFTNSGTSATISLPSFTPNSEDLCIEAASINTGSAATPTFAVAANQPFQDIGVNSVTYGNLYEPVVMRADWPSGVSSTGSITVTGTSSPTWDVVVVCFPGTVVVPLTCTMSNGAPQATVTLTESSGNALTPTSVPCDGASHSITVDPSVTLTATDPSPGPGSYTRYQFLTGTTTTDAVCAGSSNGQCAAWSFTNYYQLTNTYKASPSSPSSWDAALSIPVTGTILGTAGATVCTITTSNGGGAASCSGYADYDLPVTVGSPVAVSPTEQWAESGGNTFKDTTGGNTRIVSYIDQFAITFAVSPVGSGTTSPSGTNVWENYGLLSISATPNAGYVFSVWSSSGHILIASPGSASTSASISGAGTITAGFATTVAFAAVSDSFVFSDMATHLEVFSRTASDGFVFSQVESNLLAMSRALSDSFAFAESLSTMSTLARSVSDATTFLDSVARQVLNQRGVSDAIATAESLATLSILARGISDTSTFLESVATQSLFVRAVSDLFSATDSVTGAVTLTRTAADALAFSDSLARGLLLLAAQADSFLFSDAPGTFVSLARSVADAVAPSDVSATLSVLARTLSDAYMFAESVTVQSIFSRAVGDIYTLSDSVLRSLALNAVVSDVYGFLDGSQSLLSLARGAADSFVVSDLASGLTNALRSVLDSFVYSDLLTRIVTLLRSAADSYQFGDLYGSVTQLLENLVVNVADSYTFADTASRLAILTRFASDTVSLLEGALRTLALVRTLVDGFLTHEVVTRAVSLFTAVSDAIIGLANAVASVLSAAISSSTTSASSSASSSSSTSVTTSSTSSGTGSQRAFMVSAIILLIFILVGTFLLLLLARRRRKKEDEVRDGR